MKSRFRLIIIVLIATVIFILWRIGAFSYISVERIEELKKLIDSFGLLAPLIFITAYILATVFFLPGVPLTLLGGIVFGPIMGTIWVSLASTIGATFAFLVGRYIGRDWIVSKFSNSDIFNKLDNGVKKQGWKMIAITRLIPLVPFNAQNYVYGLTDITLKIYTLVSWIFMLPGTIAYVFLAGAIIGGEGDVSKTVTYIGIGVAILIALSILSKRYLNRGGDNSD